MRMRRGFTIVELVVVMVIMAVLLTLTMAGISSSRVAARDRERQADVEAIARGLEQRYVQGNPRVVSTPGNYTRAGGYPSVLEFLHMNGGDLTSNSFVPGQVSGGYLLDALPGTQKDNFTAPGGISGKALDIYCFYCGSGGTPENSTYIATKVTITNFVYEPLTASGAQCNAEPCTRFNLYWRKEADGSLQTIRSKHQ